MNSVLRFENYDSITKICNNDNELTFSHHATINFLEFLSDMSAVIKTPVILHPNDRKILKFLKL